MLSQTWSLCITLSVCCLAQGKQHKLFLSDVIYCTAVLTIVMHDKHIHMHISDTTVFMLQKAETTRKHQL